MVVLADGTAHGSIEGTIGGGAVEHEVRRTALDVIAQMRPRTCEVSLTTQLGMCCGGQMTFFIEALRVRPPCIVFGAGHIAEALCALAARAGYDVTIADPRDELCNVERFPDASALANGYEGDDLDALPFGPDTFVVIATHDHQVDQRLAERVLPRAFRYLGLVGSRRKALLTRERCAARGLDEARIALLRCPAGLDIGAESPEEIALSIVAQMVEVRRRGEAVAPIVARIAESA